MPSPLFQPLTDQQFHDFATLITSHLGIQLPPSKKIMLSARISRRACELGFTDVSQYHAWFFSHP
ncbi:MAG: hypothetical protein NZL93_02965, partial [Chthoniobacterales bacterium]|nr:hypothetical protein [Chthoniobacterales bacterium]